MSKGRILVVDDNPSIRGPLCFLLEDEGYEVDVASDGEEALDKIRQNKPAIVFLDVMMPKIDGYEVCRIVKNSPQTKDVYVIILTARGKSQDQETGLSAGADEYVSKPFSPTRIVEKVQRILQQHAQ